MLWLALLLARESASSAAARGVITSRASCSISCCKRVRAGGTDMNDILTASIAQLALQFRAPRGTGTEESRNSSRDGRRSYAGGLD